jgi:hypothetical protein
MLIRSRRFRPDSATAAAAVLLTTTWLAGVTLAQGPPAPDVSGQWSWTESIILTVPGDVAAGQFGVQVEGPVMHFRCQTWGDLTIQQNGTSFSGSATQQWSCVSSGGQSATSAPFPPGFGITGSIAGRGVGFVADVGQGFTCSYSGSLGVTGSVATSINATGGCDVPLPFHPNMDKSVSFDATR